MSSPIAAASVDEFDRLELIDHSEQMPPFLMTLVSGGDHWMYVSSGGALTAGRGGEDAALFPYETDDRLHRNRGVSGPVTLIRIARPGRPTVLWEPFAAGAVGVRRRLGKSVLGNCILFQEIAHGMRFSYRWETSEPFGFVRSCQLEALDNGDTSEVELLDGAVNLLPANVNLTLQQGFSCLINAYSRGEVIPGSMMALYTLESCLVDKTEAAESLAANVASYVGPAAAVTLAEDALTRFRLGEMVEPVTLLTGRRGAFLVSAKFTLSAAAPRRWRVLLDAHRDHLRVTRLRRALSQGAGVEAQIDADIAANVARLRQLLRATDAQQHTADSLICAHHAVNVLFNIMRGGVPADGGKVERDDLARFLHGRNIALARAAAGWVEKLPPRLDYSDLIERASQPIEGVQRADLLRLAMEYLPLTFGRRHGDPSRPWNRFNIRVTAADGSPVLDYQGNWRDIFQNWEALCISYPMFLPGMIAKFVNASTADGFNPYRVSRDGIDWEVPDPGHPWAHIGYWGDHQIIYLLKLLEAQQRHDPAWLRAMLDQNVFTYADVPYRLKPLSEILADRWNTIVFDTQHHRAVQERVARIGGDGRLLVDGEGSICHVTLAEKMLVPALAKLSSLIPDGGIWMNTQRPEWNDANNALVGSGISVVTLCYLRRYLAFVTQLLRGCGLASLSISVQVIDWAQRIFAILEAHESSVVGGKLTPTQRMQLLLALGESYSQYRQAIYRSAPGPAGVMQCSAALSGLELAMRWVDASIAANRRSDGLYHAYNLLDLSEDRRQVTIGRLNQMLEGQVAVLSSGTLGADAAADLVDAMFASPLYRPDQNSFMLYPLKSLPSFLEKNRVDESKLNPLLEALLQSGDSRLVVRDADAVVRFAAAHRNAGDLARTLEVLAADPLWARPVADHRRSTLDLFEQTFNHRAFTGRSGSMYRYEGIGCIYWHMVAKLLLAVQECFFAAAAKSNPAAERLRDAYYRVRGGLGFNKTPRQYGAFPLDPYSHTPLHAGAQQPGMTGQVKEEILTRFGELGVSVIGGRIALRPALLRQSEYFAHPTVWHGLELPADSLGFTLAATPIIYTRGVESCISVQTIDGVHRVDGDTLDAASSRAVLQRSGQVKAIFVTVPRV